eukprot:767793-Hanusia_phi.AAC.6
MILNDNLTVHSSQFASTVLSEHCIRFIGTGKVVMMTASPTVEDSASAVKTSPRDSASPGSRAAGAAVKGLQLPTEFRVVPGVILHRARGSSSELTPSEQGQKNKARNYALRPARSRGVTRNTGIIGGGEEVFKCLPSLNRSASRWQGTQCLAAGGPEASEALPVPPGDHLTATAITNGESGRTQRKLQPNGHDGHRDATGVEKKLRTTGSLSQITCDTSLC